MGERENEERKRQKKGERQTGVLEKQTIVTIRMFNGYIFAAIGLAKHIGREYSKRDGFKDRQGQINVCAWIHKHVLLSSFTSCILMLCAQTLFSTQPPSRPDVRIGQSEKNC